MANLKELKNRITSVTSTQKITKAMQMVAASKMRRAQQAALSGRPYAQLMNKVLAEVTDKAGDFTHPLMEARTVERTGVLVVGTDKGLCGALNSNLFREVTQFDKDSSEFVAAGRKASQFVARTKRQLAAEFSYKDAPEFSEARVISKFVQQWFLEGKVDRVDMVFTNFISTLVQRSEVRILLPLSEIKAVDAGVEGASGDTALERGTTEFLFEPGPNDVLGALLPHYLNFQIYQILLEAKASEHSARMVAMKSATDNAQQLIKDLTLEYNKIRQANITREILEISSAAMALG